MHRHPLLNEATLNSEVHNIESEFQISYSSEIRRVNEVFCEVMDKSHPFAVFGAGNLKTLKDVFVKAQETLKDDKFTAVHAIKYFQRKYYNPSNAVLTISSHLEFEELKDLVDANFSEWENKEVDQSKVSELFMDRNANFDKLPFSESPQIILMKGIQSSSAMVLANQF